MVENDREVRMRYLCDPAAHHVTHTCLGLTHFAQGAGTLQAQAHSTTLYLSSPQISFHHSDSCIILSLIVTILHFYYVNTLTALKASFSFFSRWMTIIGWSILPQYITDIRYGRYRFGVNVHSLNNMNIMVCTRIR